ncbi:hypothetical protein A2U01_0050269, partial [Trifolium medium]|nr:hypothetical protein [Trifolium medium]
KCCPVKLAGRDQAITSEQEPESSSLQRQKATESIRNLKVPGFSEQQATLLAGRLAGRACSVLENKVAV